jgi:DNA-binding SARP family transcriptional activator
LRVCLLAQPRLEWPDGRQRLLERRDAALLALLALDGAVPRARAAAHIWPDVDAERARNNLRQRLFRLRHAAECDLVVASDMLRLADGIDHDLQAGDSAAELLEGLDYSDCPELDDRIAAARERWRAQRVQAWVAAGSRCEDERDLDGALRHAQRVLDHDPLDEAAHRRVMRLHYLRGDRAATLAAYARLRDLLASRHAEPQPETRELTRLVEHGGIPLHAPARALPPAVLRPPRLVGRESEWRALHAARLDGCAVLLMGEAGVGKTRLLGDFASAQGAHVEVSARPGDAPVPYALLARLLRALPEPRGAAPWARQALARLLPEWGAAPPGRLDPLHVRAATAHLLGDAAAGATLTVVLDDLHFADAATLEAMPGLVAETHAHVHWLLGSRPAVEGPPALGACIVALGALDRPRVQPLELAPLDAVGVYALIASLELPALDARAWAPALWRRSGGNPLFLLEVLRELLRGDGAASPGELPTPAPLARMVARRLELLSAGALRLARLAALAGADFDLPLAAAVLGQHVLDLAEPWRELLDAHIVRDEGFAHDLVLEATRAGVPDPVARSLHAQIATQLASRGIAPARVAAHWHAGQCWREAAAAHEAAAREALAASRRTDELAHWRSAVDDWLAAGEPGAAFAARAQSLGALMLVDSIEQAQRLADDLVADARNDAQRLEALLARSQTLLMAVRHEQALATASDAHALAAALGDAARERRAARYVAVALAQGQRAEEAVELLEPYRAGLSDELTDDDAYQYWSDFAYVLHSARKLGRCVAALERAIAGSEARADLAETYSSLSNLSGVKGNLGRFDEAMADAERAERLGERLGDIGGVPAGSVKIHLGLLCAAGGRLGRALAHFDAAHEMFAKAGHGTWVMIVRNHRANVLLLLGQVARAHQALPPEDESAHTPTRSRRLVIAARIEEAMQRDPRPLLQRALAVLGEAGDPYGKLLAEIDLLRMEDPAHAVRHALALEAQARRIEYLSMASKARWYRVDALRRDGRLADASALAHEALDDLATVRPWDMYLPEAWWIAHRAFDENAEHEASEAMLAVARAWIAEAMSDVPPAFGVGFEQRNPVNRALLARISARR